jgi:hypothetical protein
LTSRGFNKSGLTETISKAVVTSKCVIFIVMINQELSFNLKANTALNTQPIREGLRTSPPPQFKILGIGIVAVVKAGNNSVAAFFTFFFFFFSGRRRRKLEIGSSDGRSSKSSGNPVVGSSSHHSIRSFVSESGATIHHKVEKAFQFFSHEKS